MREREKERDRASERKSKRVRAYLKLYTEARTGIEQIEEAQLHSLRQPCGRSLSLPLLLRGGGCLPLGLLLRLALFVFVPAQRPHDQMELTQRARIQGAQTFVSLISRLESNTEEEKTHATSLLAGVFCSLRQLPSSRPPPPPYSSLDRPCAAANLSNTIPLCLAAQNVKSPVPYRLRCEIPARKKRLAQRPNDQMELTLLASLQRVLEAVAAFLSASSSCALRLIVPARGLVFKACVSLSSGLESNNEEEDRSCATPTLSNRSGTSHNFEEGHCRGSCLPLCLLLLLALLLIVPAQRTVDQMKLTHPPTLPSRVNLPHAINFRALCAADLVKSRSKKNLQRVFAALAAFLCASSCALRLIIPAGGLVI